MNNLITENSISDTAIKQKAVMLGIATENRSISEIIRNIQRAEGYNPCFRSNYSDCPHSDCCFRSECIHPKQPAFLESVKIPKLNYSTMVPWSVIVTSECLANGTLILPRGLTKLFQGTNTIHTLYDDIDDVLPYCEETRLVEGMDFYYNLKDIKTGDIVHLQLKSLNPTKIKVYLGWLKNTFALMGDERKKDNNSSTSRYSCGLPQ